MARFDSHARSRTTRSQIEPLEGRRLLSSSITGVVFNDVDVDGMREVGEAGLAKQVVFIDTNFNGQLDSGELSTKTNSTGAYSFDGLAAGIYRVRLIVPNAMRQTAPASGFYDIATNGLDIHAANDFGLTGTAIVRGNVFNDTNGNGAKDIAEQGIAGVLVFIDKNRNGKLDAGEKSRRTNANGDYRFNALPPGSYVIRVSSPKGMSATTPGMIKLSLKSGQSRSNRNFGLA